MTHEWIYQLNRFEFQWFPFYNIDHEWRFIVNFLPLCVWETISFQIIRLIEMHFNFESTIRWHSTLTSELFKWMQIIHISKLQTRSYIFFLLYFFFFVVAFAIPILYVSKFIPLKPVSYCFIYDSILITRKAKYVFAQ